jgi:hypothetical protein
MRGNRVSKIDNWGVHEAFASPAFPRLGRMGLDFELNTSLLQHPPKGRLRVGGQFSSDVGSCTHAYVRTHARTHTHTHTFVHSFTYCHTLSHTRSH